MKSAYGVEIAENLEEFLDPKRCALIAYDMQAGIVEQIQDDLGFVPIVVRDACGAGNRDAADRALQTLEFLGDTIVTDSAAIKTAMNGPRRGRGNGG